MSLPTHCPCGSPLHYTDDTLRDHVQRLVDNLGECIEVDCGSSGGWLVPRHYIALHGVHAKDIVTLAMRHGWKPVRPRTHPLPARDPVRDLETDLRGIGRWDEYVRLCDARVAAWEAATHDLMTFIDDSAQIVVPDRVHMQPPLEYCVAWDMVRVALHKAADAGPNDLLPALLLWIEQHSNVAIVVAEHATPVADPGSPN